MSDFNYPCHGIKEGAASGLLSDAIFHPTVCSLLFGVHQADLCSLEFKDPHFIWWCSSSGTSACASRKIQQFAQYDQFYQVVLVSSNCKPQGVKKSTGLLSLEKTYCLQNGSLCLKCPLVNAVFDGNRHFTTFVFFMPHK